MSGHQRPLEAARAAKDKARAVFAGRARVTGVGLTRRRGRYCIKVNLACEPPADANLPDSIDGVPVILHVTGAIRKQTRAGR